MISSTAAYKEAIADTARTTRITGTLTLSDTTEIDITDADILQGSLYFNEQCVSGEDIEIGNVYASEMGVSLVTPTVSPYLLTGAKLDLDFGILRNGALTNLVTNGNFASGTTGWSTANATISLDTDWSSPSLKVSETTANVVGYSIIPFTHTIGDKYYYRCTFRSNSEFTGGGYAGIRNRRSSSGNVILFSNSVEHIGVGTIKTLSAVVIATTGADGVCLSVYDPTTNANVSFDNILAINLKDTFGAGNEPTQAWCDANIPWFGGTIYSPDALKVWEDIPLGVFNITKINRKINCVECQALDNMINLDVALGATNVTAQTPEQLIANACTTAGVTLATTHTTFETYPNKALSLTLPSDSKVLTCRDLIMWTCQINSTFARMNRVGELEILPLHSVSARTITADERYSPTVVSDTGIKVTKIETEILGAVYSTGSSGMTMVLDGNPLLETQGTINTIIAAILADITQAEYTPFKSDFIGDPSIQAGDYITLSDTGSLVSDPVGLVTSTNWKYRGKHSLISAGKEGNIRAQYSQQNKAISAIKAVSLEGMTLAMAAQDAADLLNNAIGGNVLIRENGANNEILIMDNIDPTLAVKVWRWNMAGLGYSYNKTGVDTAGRTYTVAITADGKINADFISVGKLLGEFIEAYSITVDKLASSVGEELDISSNEGITLKADKTYVDAIQIGGRNLLLSSGTPVTTTGYLVKTVTLSKDLVAGQKYTMVLKGSVVTGNQFVVWMNNGNNRMGGFPYKAGNVVNTMVFTAVAPTAGNERKLLIFAEPANATSKTIDWVALYEGDIKPPLDWTPAPEDNPTTANIISTINLSPESITIAANNISLEGLVSVNSNFKILADGSMEAVNGKFGGTITVGGVNNVKGTMTLLDNAGATMGVIDNLGINIATGTYVVGVEGSQGRLWGAGLEITNDPSIGGWNGSHLQLNHVNASNPTLNSSFYIDARENLIFIDTTKQVNWDLHGFTITQTNWFGVTFLNGWANYGGSFGNAAYMKDTLGFVHLKSVVKSGTVGAAVFNLPVGYRPPFDIYQVISSNNAFGTIMITAGGNVSMQIGSNVSMCLDSIAFKAA